MKIIETISKGIFAGDLKPGDIFQSTQDRTAYYLMVDLSKFPTWAAVLGSTKILVLDLRTSALSAYYKTDAVVPHTGELKVSPGRDEGGKA